MTHAAPITTLFLDIGGVVLSDGWDHHARRRAATTFALDWADFERRHRAAFEVFEAGRITLEEYLALVIFHRKRAFTRARFRRFMYAQSQPHPRMLALIARLKATHALKIVVVSNEARELNAYRIRTFGLGDIVDFFVTSCFVDLRKPDVKIFELALDLAQVPAREVLYVEDTPMFVEVAERLGIRGVIHIGYGSTCTRLASLGLNGVDRAVR